MRNVRLLLAAAFLVLVPLTALAAAPVYTACSGSYALKSMTDWETIRNDNRYYSQIPVLAARPGDISDSMTEAEKAVASYGFITLGTAQEGVFVAFGRTGSGNVDFLYVDADNDKQFNAEERVELKKNSPYAREGSEYQWTESIKSVNTAATYARNDGTTVSRPVALQFYFLRRTVVGSRGAANVVRYFSDYVINTWFAGTGRFKTGKDEKEMPFAILDGNDNGVFNDYGRDILIVDANGDGQFDMEKEMAQLLEFDETKLDSKTVAQNRKVMFAWPTTLVVKPGKEAVDWTAVEPN